MAPKLYDAGMTLEEERLLWTSFICALTPRSDYNDVYGILNFAADVAGMPQHKDKINAAYREIELNADDPFKGEVKEGCGRLNIKLDGSLDKYQTVLYALGAGQSRPALSWPNMDDKEIFLMLDEGEYLLQLKLIDMEAGEISGLFYTGNGWSEDAQQAVTVTLKDKEALELTASLD